MATKPSDDASFPGEVDTGPTGDVKPDPRQPGFGSLIEHRTTGGTEGVNPVGDAEPDPDQGDFGSLDEQRPIGGAGAGNAGHQSADKPDKAKKHKN